MTKKELARLLGVSPSIVSRHAKNGMPTDSLERAQKWRKKHLESARVKGARFDPNAQQTGGAETAAPLVKTRAFRGGVALVETLARATSATLANAPASNAADMVAELRVLLRGLPQDAKPRMALRVWLVLVDYFLHPESDQKQSSDLTSVLTPDEFCARMAPHCITRIGVVWLDAACDWDGYSTTGWPAELCGAAED
ncbi:hypothetical protein [Rhodoferax sp.]|uniref:hypothetical protein n=1 Tax=Rhodoferax sp. TaxID=50421 RepID=UPI002629AA75|nr:hypothetical protein [Rhodoferax sp.]MDD3936853.1 hypothetical protein [Rhodoferax sp.]